MLKPAPAVTRPFVVSVLSMVVAPTMWRMSDTVVVPVRVASLRETARPVTITPVKSTDDPMPKSKSPTNLTGLYGEDVTVPESSTSSKSQFRWEKIGIVMLIFFGFPSLYACVYVFRLLLPAERARE